jgi:hypothetical protein
MERVRCGDCQRFMPEDSEWLRCPACWAARPFCPRAPVTAGTFQRDYSNKPCPWCGKKVTGALFPDGDLVSAFMHEGEWTIEYGAGNEVRLAGRIG